jgi:hypothetical protein
MKCQGCTSSSTYRALLIGKLQDLLSSSKPNPSSQQILISVFHSLFLRRLLLNNCVTQSLSISAESLHRSQRWIISFFLYVKGEAKLAKVSVRIPSWTSTDNAVATLNGQKLNLASVGNSSNGNILF